MIRSELIKPIRIDDFATIEEELNGTSTGGTSTGGTSTGGTSTGGTSTGGSPSIPEPDKIQIPKPLPEWDKIPKEPQKIVKDEIRDTKPPESKNNYQTTATKPKTKQQKPPAGNGDSMIIKAQKWLQTGNNWIFAAVGMVAIIYLIRQ